MAKTLLNRVRARGTELELQAAKDAGMSDNEQIVLSAMQMRETIEKARKQTKADLLRAYGARPLNDIDLRDALTQWHRLLSRSL